MNEFEEKDYEQARSLANAIKDNANNIMGIFDDIDNTMNQLYGQNWSSSGAEGAHDRYNEIRTNYQVFYDNVIAMNTHVLNVTAANESADAAAENIISAN